MCSTRVLRSLVAFSAAAVVFLGYAGGTIAQTAPPTAQDQDVRMKAMQQQIDELNKQLKQMKEEQAKTTKTVSTVDKAFATFMKGFYGTLDISIDATTKGMEGLVAYPYALAPGVTSPNGPFVVAGGPKAPPFGRVGWIPAMSSNGSNVGYRGSHKIGKSDVEFIFQVSTALNLAAAPGIANTWTKQSNTVVGAIGLGDTYIGFQGPRYGKLKFGTMFMPYKTSTDRLNPFAGQLGNYSVVMGNTGGDNRIEFGTRADHLILFNSPTYSGFSFDVAYQFGQNVDLYSNIISLGGTDCYGGNLPGSGNLPLNCDDGGYNYGFSGDLKFEKGGLYLVAAYELHNGVNRSSDGVGSNHPYYGYIYGQGLNGLAPCAPGTPGGPGAAFSQYYLDWADFNAFCAEYPGAAPAGSPEYNVTVDVANEWAMKFGGQYSFEFGLTISYLWEAMYRDVPQQMQFQNERQRSGDWLALQWDFNGGRDRVAVGWAHATATPGDPGGQHNFNPQLLGNNQANMYTIAYWHKLDKQLTAYLAAAETVNDGNAHYDLGAGGHGIKTDCHDATHPLFIDYSSAGPTTWGGCHPIGVSMGISYRF